MDEPVTIRRGAASVTLVPATEETLAAVMADLRDEDRYEHEFFARLNADPTLDTLAAMEKAWICRIGDDTVGFVGLQVPPMQSVMSNVRYIPMLSTEAANRHRIDYARLTRPTLAFVVAAASPWVSDFLSMPLERYAASVRWHERTMGWRRAGETDLGGERAVLFHLNRKEISPCC